MSGTASATASASATALATVSEIAPEGSSEARSSGMGSASATASAAASATASVTTSGASVRASSVLVSGGGRHRRVVIVGVFVVIEGVVGGVWSSAQRAGAAGGRARSSGREGLGPVDVAGPTADDLPGGTPPDFGGDRGV